MELITSFFRFFLIFFTVKTVFNIIFRAKLMNKQKVKSHREDNLRFHEETVEKEISIDMVYDEVCEVYVPKTKAYQVVEDDKTHYFCSWECRQKYVDQA